MHFELEELGAVAPAGARESFMDSWHFQRPERQSISLAGGVNGAVGTAQRPNVLAARKGKPTIAGPHSPASATLLPIPPPGAPQKITRTADGKRRIQPTFLGLGGITPQPLPSSITQLGETAPAIADVNAVASRGQTVSAYQPAFMPHGDGSTLSRGAAPAWQNPEQSGPGIEPQFQSSHRSSLQNIGIPSWGATQDQPVPHALQANAKRRRLANDDVDDGDALLASTTASRSLAPNRPPGRYLGGDQAWPAFTGEPVILRPAYIPKTIIELSREALELAVPAVHACLTLRWDSQDEAAERLEIRNHADPSS